ncbi:patatin-like phospholipase family protein [Actinokineospora diospyrosa]|uniref:NTE family protein n=1 Tax=Actinokineospora diospyrosa TaxID=103728 RepID=A0ABT1IMF9_9PSEU|nr:patatin-like phospholipase family protein [Actinokineospora diospyrosa]MCP2273855.1 NTE family protein [Actinokineospora diospyrosa]
MSGPRLPRPTGFVFGGGAASTAAQVGMLKAVLAAGIEPDLVVGTSAGALNGAVLAKDPKRAVEVLTRVWCDCRRSTVIGDTRFRVLRNLLGGHYMFRGDRLAELFDREVGVRTFAELPVRFACVATDLESGEPALLDEGDLVSALHSTCAIPGVFPVPRRDGRLLADGAYVANVPIRQALSLGAASLVVFDSRPRITHRGDPKDVRDTMTFAFAAALKQQYERDVEHARASVPVLCPPGQPTSHIKGFDFTGAPAMIATAEAATAAWLGHVVTEELPHPA